ncbi:hypothetical protein ACP70R_028237 [Stipagrostis hirtigluma subsp. patula]
MDDEEHEVYGQEIPVHGDMDSAYVGMGTAVDDAAKVPPLDPCLYPNQVSSVQLQELAALRDMQVKVAKKTQDARYVALTNPVISPVKARESSQGYLKSYLI